ncbi:sigma factor-like helix-turn-helix DNA-binding protein [Streptomyces sp. NRRL S-1448]|uniref:sigma factor-like helix-turn-helix DNA-binding protein n=1 Tax=Streptomyces sp. NRRL S-1448 TaxID=1463883 RepID=UPI000690BF08|nr:sigma factor-like helix-turn-helix DNA-binding protein [Streptomyces sp. NRRL S-1448]
MRERRPAQQRRHAREFESFVAGAAGRLFHAATLLTGEPAAHPAPAAEDLLIRALARTYADWDRLRGEDPYERTRRELADRFARTARRHRRPRGGPLDRLTPQERLVLVLRLHEGVAEEQAAAQLGLPAERVRALYLHAVAAFRSHRPARRVRDVEAPTRVRGGEAP